MTEMAKLAEKLMQNNIPFEINYMDKTLFSRCGESVPQIVYPNSKKYVCDVICHKYSYGGDHGLLEIMGLTDNEYDDVEGYLTAEEVFKKIFNHYKKTLDKHKKM